VGSSPTALIELAQDPSPIAHSLHYRLSGLRAGFDFRLPPLFAWVIVLPPAAPSSARGWTRGWGSRSRARVGAAPPDWYSARQLFRTAPSRWVRC